jgi:predicted PurR-regulated permease PerM
MKSTSEYTFSINPYSVIQIITLAIIIFAIIQFKDIVVLFILAFILSSGIMLGSNEIRKKIPISYKLGVALIISIILAIITLLSVLIIPALKNESQNLANNFPQFIQEANTIVQNVTGLKNMNIIDYFEGVGKGDDTVSQYAWDIVTGVFFTTKNVINTLIYIGFLLVTTFYMAIQPKSFDELIQFFFSKKKAPYVADIIQKSREKAGYWILGQCLISAILTSITYVVLFFLGIPYALLLSVIAGVFNLIPFIGPLLSMIPTVIFALFVSLQSAIIIGLFYLGVQQLDGHFMTPLIMRKVTGLHSLIIMISILVGTALAGALGALIAVPIISVLSLFYKELEA